MITVDPDFDYSEPTLLRLTATECAELRDLCAGVAQERERMACERPEFSAMLQPSTMRIRKRLFEAGGR